MTSELYRKLLALAAGCAAMVGASGVNAQTVVFHETFGNADARVSSPYVPQEFPGQPIGYYSPRLTGVIQDGTYAIMRPQAVQPGGGSWWANLPTDHSGDATGALMVLNAGRTLSDFYRRNFDVKAGASYEISVWRYVVNANGSAPIAWSLQVKQVNSGDVLVKSGPISNTTVRAWEQSTFSFTIPASCAAATGSQATMALTNQSPIAAGNDIYIDDIKVTELPLDPSLPSACPSERSAVDAVDNAATTPPDTAVTINVLGNDTTSAGTLGAPVIDTPPAASMGTAVVNADGTITFTPAAGFTGVATFTYRVCNDATPVPACDTAKVNVTVAPPGTVTAAPDSASTPSATPVSINVRANDSTTAGNLLAPVIENPPAANEGTASVNPDGTITFTPAPGFTGVATFTYRVCNDANPSVCSTAQVDVNVTDISAVPTLDVWALLGLGSLLGWLGMRRSRR